MSDIVVVGEEKVLEGEGAYAVPGSAYIYPWTGDTWELRRPHLSADSKLSLSPLAPHLQSRK
jgi:hypothetical protein